MNYIPEYGSIKLSFSPSETRRKADNVLSVMNKELERLGVKGDCKTFSEVAERLKEVKLCNQ